MSSYEDKILGLMAKAESTEFPQEAEALFAKAQELMTKHAIDSAMLAGFSKTDEIVTETITCPAPYSAAKSTILENIAKANGCHAIRLSGTTKSSITGYASDVESVKLLFTNLIVHAAKDMMRTEVPWTENARSFRSSFMYAFAWRIGDRLQEAKKSAVGEAEASTPGAGLVLVQRDELVENEFNQLWPKVVQRKVKTKSWAGVQAGRESASRAGLNQTPIQGSKGALTS